MYLFVYNIGICKFQVFTSCLEFCSQISRIGKVRLFLIYGPDVYTHNHEIVKYSSWMSCVIFDGLHM